MTLFISTIWTASALRRTFIYIAAAALMALSLPVDASMQRPFGTGVGNHFVHKVEDDFDFHIAFPADWNFESTPSLTPLVVATPPAQATKEWRISNKDLVSQSDRTSWLTIDFISGFPAAGEDELLTQIKKLHPEINSWQKADDDTKFVGFTSGNIPDGSHEATHGYAYYLAERNQVVSLAWRKDSYKQGASQLEWILRSVDRASSSPHPSEVATTSDTPYHVGDKACYSIKVDDLKGSFNENGARNLTKFEIEGAPAYHSFKSITWLAPTSEFRVCFTVTSAFARDGLRIKELSVSNDRGMSTECKGDEERLHCDTSKGDFTIKTHIAPVDNPQPDRSGPAITQLELTQATGKPPRLSLRASDETGIYMGRITASNGLSIVLYPDQLASGEVEVELSPLVTGGWTTIESIALFDANGLPTVLKSNKGKTYEETAADGRKTPTTYPVISFLNH